MKRNSFLTSGKQNWAVASRIGCSILLAAVAFGIGCARPAQAKEEAALFLNELRARGYYDTANEYLDSIKDSDLVDDEFKKSIPYEQALSLVSRASTEGDARQREKLLREGIKRFKEFAAAQPKHPLVNDVRLQVSNVYVGLANAKMLEADRPSADKTAVHAEARDLFTAALAEAVEAEQLIQAERKKIEPVPPDKKDLIERRDKLRADWVKSELLQAAIQYEMSKTFPKDSDEKKAQLTKAAKDYEGLYEKHRRRLAGLYSRVQQGRCLLDKGDYEEALNCFVDLVDQETKIPQLRALQLEALRYSMECWIAQKKYKDAITMAGIKLRPGEDKVPAGYALRFFRARAEHEQAKTLGPDQAAKKTSLLGAASRTYKELTKTKGEWQKPSQEQLIALGKGEDLDTDKEPTNFDEAFEKAIASMQKRGVYGAAIAKAPAAKKKELEQKLADETKEAFKYYRMAVSFADNDTMTAKLSNCQKALCYLFYDRGDTIHAAVIGEYLGRQYPQSPADKFGTWIALNSWLREYGTAWQDHDFETERIKSLAMRIVERWPDSTEAVEASYQLVVFAIQAGDPEAAVKHLAGIPVDSPRRNKAEIKVGQLLWNKYASSKRLPGDARPAQEVLDGYLQNARQILTDGLQRAESAGEVDSTLIGGAYALSQLFAAINEPAEAIKLFEHEKYGPLTLVDAGDPVAISGNYPLKTYRLALRSYVGALPSAGDAAARQQLLDKAMGVVDKLEKAVGTDQDAENRLTAIYIEMGAELEVQIQNLVDQGDDDGRKALSEAFETFLRQIRKRPEANTYKSLIWIAETFFSLGKSNDTGDGEANQVAATYYDEAAKTYKQILSNPSYIKSPRQKTTIELRLASCYRRQGEHKDALDQLVKILERKAGNLTVQVAAAETLYEAGGKGDCDGFTKSILGAFPNEDTEKNVVWGWRKLAQQTRKDERFASYFYQASLYGIRARRGLAQCVKNDDAEKAGKILNAAKVTLLQLQRQYPELGGENSKREFEAEMVRIQEAMGEEAVGLPVLEVETDAINESTEFED